MMYKECLGNGRNFQQALGFFQQAALQGLAKGQGNLGG